MAIGGPVQRVGANAQDSGSLCGRRGGRRDKKDRGVLQGRLRIYSIVKFICFDASTMLPGTENGGCFFSIEADDSWFEVFHPCRKGSGIIIGGLNVSIYACCFFGYIGQSDSIVKEPSIFGSVEYAVCKAGIA